MSIGPTVPKIWPIVCLTLKIHIRNFEKKRIVPKSFQYNSSKIQSGYKHGRGILSSCFVAIEKVVHPLSCRRAHFWNSGPQLWPCVKVTERSSSTFPQIYTFFVPNIYPDSKVHGANTGPNWVLSAPNWPHVGPMNLAIRDKVKLTQFSHEKQQSLRWRWRRWRRRKTNWKHKITPDFITFPWWD